MLYAFETIEGRQNNSLECTSAFNLESNDIFSSPSHLPSELHCKNKNKKLEDYMRHKCHMSVYIVKKQKQIWECSAIQGGESTHLSCKKTTVTNIPL